MLFMVFMSTFSLVALVLMGVWHRFWGRRRIHDILSQRDPTAQKATAVRRLSVAKNWDRVCKQAGLDWTVRHYVLTIVGGGALAFVLILTGARTGALLVLASAGAGPWLAVRYLRQVRTRQFAEQLPAALTLAANTIRAGGTMLQAVKAIAKGMPDPIKGEFSRIEHALQLHVPLASALEQASQRVGATQFEAVVVACKVASEAGADLDAILESIAREIVEERQFRDAMRTASSEPRMTARIVTGFPFLMAAVFFWNDPSYFEPYLSNIGGNIVLIFALGLIGLGWYVITRMTDVQNW